MHSPETNENIVSDSRLVSLSATGSVLNAVGIQVWLLLKTSLQQSIPVMLLYVLESNGSSPGRQGFSMAVNGNGEIAGSIGGGIMEHKFVEMAKDRLKTSAGEIMPAIRKQVHDKSVAKDQSGMICSGDQTILIYPVRSSDIIAVQEIIDCLRALKNGTLVLSPAGLSFSLEVNTIHYSFTRSKGYWLYTEKLGYKNHLYIIGGGHCALALSKLMSGMDFYIHIFDDRASLNTMQQNIYVHEKTCPESYSELSNLIAPGINHFVVVMTFGYRTDDIAIRALLGKSFVYFGVLGSKKKIEKLFSGYIAEGISKDLLQNIHAPVGLTINSRTPEEIAVSIAAEIIQVKNC